VDNFSTEAKNTLKHYAYFRGGFTVEGCARAI
jgi:hypothetical protein